MAGLFTFLVLVGLGFFFGRMNEAKHFRSLNAREDELAHITMSNTKQIPDGMTGSAFVHGNVVVSIDYFKRIGAALRGLVGGRMETYTTLLERARREAVLRMKAEAQAGGMTHVANVRLVSASVFTNAQSQIGSIEVFAYGTALK
ncbi:MAG: heavy metal-binding domain-containing protein [Robiginitomaculum sp.]|nr:heavy metal-binding domain-containing protein [Robiginitomaculum sp.]